MISNSKKYKPNILIVDDIKTNIQLLEYGLGKLNANLIIATSGKEALQKIQNCELALAIIDVVMPEMDGFQLATTIRSDKNRKVFPIIFVTAINRDESSIFKAYGSGIVDYLFKPVNLEILINKVKIFLELDRQKQEIITGKRKLQKSFIKLKRFKQKLEVKNKNLKISEKRFKIVSKLSSDFSYEFEIDPENKFKLVWITKAFKYITGYIPEEINDYENWEIFIHPDDRKKAFQRLTRISAGENDITEYRIITKNNKIKWLRDFAKPTFNSNDVFTGFIGTAKDITNSRKANELIQESEEKFRFAFFNAPVGMVLLALDGQFLQVNDTFCNMLGYSEKKLLSMSYLDVTHPEDRDKSKLWIKELLEEKIKTSDIEKKYLDKNGKIVWVIVRSILKSDINGKPLYLISHIKDISLQKKNEKAIRLAHDQAKAYARKLQLIREEERKSIAREIHDEFGQVLTALKMNLSLMSVETMKNKNQLNFEYFWAEIENLKTMIDSTIRNVRVFTNKLRPDILDNFGIIDAIEAYIFDFTELYNIPCNFYPSAATLNIDNEKSTVIYRIVQEALTNIVRHAKASEINVKLNVLEESLQLIIEDNGIGFNEENLNNEKKFGLIGMKERADICDGKITIIGTPGKGTRIELILPTLK